MSPLPPAGAEPEIRDYRPGDEEEINRAFNLTFGAGRPLAEWAWKFPAEGGGREHVVVALAGGEVAAHFAAQPVAVQVDGRVLRAGHSVDAFATARPGRRGGGLARRGVYARTVERFYAEHGGPDGLAFLYGFPGRRHLALGRRLLGYVEPRPVGYFRRPELPPVPPASAPRRSLADRLARRAVSALVDRAADDRLWARAAGRYPVAAVRDGARLARRFTGRPGVVYHRRTVWRRGEPRATAAFRAEGPLLRWAELVWDGDSPADLAALDRAVTAAGRALGAAAGELWLGGDPAAEAALAARGWHRERQPDDLQLTAVSLTAGLEAAPLVARLYVTLADSDLV